MFVHYACCTSVRCFACWKTEAHAVLLWKCVSVLLSFDKNYFVNILHWLEQGWEQCFARGRYMIPYFSSGCTLRVQRTFLLHFTLSRHQMSKLNHEIHMLQESTQEGVITRDIHRTFPAHDYFKDTDGDGQDSLYKICKVTFCSYLSPTNTPEIQWHATFLAVPFRLLIAKCPKIFPFFRLTSWSGHIRWKYSWHFILALQYEPGSSHLYCNSISSPSYTWHYQHFHHPVDFLLQHSELQRCVGSNKTDHLSIHLGFASNKVDEKCSMSSFSYGKCVIYQKWKKKSDIYWAFMLCVLHQMFCIL